MRYSIQIHTEQIMSLTSCRVVVKRYPEHLADPIVQAYKSYPDVDVEPVQPPVDYLRDVLVAIIETL